MGLKFRLTTAAAAAATGLLLASAPACAGLAASPLGQGQEQRAIALTFAPLPEPPSGTHLEVAPASEPCAPGQKTVMMQSLESLAAAGSGAPTAQAAVLVSGLVVLASAGLLLKQQSA